MRGEGQKRRWTTTRDQNDMFFLLINLGQNEILIQWLVAKKIAEVQTEPHNARYSSWANKSSTLLNCGRFNWRVLMKRKETGFEVMGFPRWANWLQHWDRLQVCRWRENNRTNISEWAKIKKKKGAGIVGSWLWQWPAVPFLQIESDLDKLEEMLYHSNTSMINASLTTEDHLKEKTVKSLWLQ